MATKEQADNSPQVIELVDMIVREIVLREGNVAVKVKGVKESKVTFDAIFTLSVDKVEEELRPLLEKINKLISEKEKENGDTGDSETDNKGDRTRQF